MSISYTENKAVFNDTVSAEDAETFLEWVAPLNNASLDMSECLHIHTAVLQVLMAAENINIEKMPEDKLLNDWLNNTLNLKVKIEE